MKFKTVAQKVLGGKVASTLPNAQVTPAAKRAPVRKGREYSVMSKRKV
jgi:hypothetical protein